MGNYFDQPSCRCMALPDFSLALEHCKPTYSAYQVGKSIVGLPVPLPPLFSFGDEPFPIHLDLLRVFHAMQMDG